MKPSLSIPPSTPKLSSVPRLPSNYYRKRSDIFMSRYELRFSGAGGQGLITAGIIMAKAASIYEGKQAVQSQSYGPEARGGASKSEVIISDGPIDYPKITKCDALLAMTQEAANKYSHDLKEGGVLLIDSDLVKNIPAGNFKMESISSTPPSLRSCEYLFAAS